MRDWLREPLAPVSPAANFVPDQAEARAEVLERYASLFRANQNPDDLVYQLLPIVRSWGR